MYCVLIERAVYLSEHWWQTYEEYALRAREEEERRKAEKKEEREKKLFQLLQKREDGKCTVIVCIVAADRLNLGD